LTNGQRGGMGNEGEKEQSGEAIPLGKWKRMVKKKNCQDQEWAIGLQGVVKVKFLAKRTKLTPGSRYSDISIRTKNKGGSEPLGEKKATPTRQVTEQLEVQAPYAKAKLTEKGR